jgi:catalase
VRGFATKFYTNEGNWDLVGNNIPVFFIQDPMKFPDLVHSVKEAPDRGFPQAQSAHGNFWDFISLSPEAVHMTLWQISDRTIPRSLRFMDGFGVHTFRLINAKGKSHFVKFHWKPRQGVQSVEWNEAVKINGADPDFHRRDMWEAIDAGDFPQWDLGIQVFDDDFAHAKFIGWTPGADPLLRAVGVMDRRDDGVIALEEKTVSDFAEHCRTLRFWPREDAMM